MIKPTNVVVTVRQARHLIIKAKDGVNKAYATIQLLKDKYMTDVEESLIPKWQTKCSFPLTPETYANPKASILVCVYDKRTGLYGLEPDEFLGQVSLPLSSLNYADKTFKTKWYKLAGRKSANKQRGDIELTIGFSSQAVTGDDDYEKRKRSSKNIFSGVKDRLKLSRASKLPQTSQSQLTTLQQPPSSQPARRSRQFSSISLQDESVFSSHHSKKSDPEKLKKTYGSSSFTTQKFLFPSVTSDEVFHTSDALYKSPNRARASKQHEFPQRRRASSVIEVNINAIEKKSARKYNSTWNSTKDKDSVRLKSSSMLALGAVDQPSWMDDDENQDSPSKAAQIRNKLKLNFLTSSKLKRFISTDKRTSLKKESSLETIRERNDESLLSPMPRDQLVQLVRDQQLLLQEKDDQIQELQDYIDKLLVKVIARSPQLLEESSCKTL